MLRFQGVVVGGQRTGAILPTMGRIAQQPTANGGRYRPRTGRWRGSADGETGRRRGSADGKTGRWRGPADGNARLIRRLGASRRLIGRINANGRLIGRWMPFSPRTGRWRGPADGNARRGSADGNTPLVSRLGASRRLIGRINANGRLIGRWMPFSPRTGRWRGPADGNARRGRWERAGAARRSRIKRVPESGGHLR